MHYFTEEEPPEPRRCRMCKRWFLEGDTCLEEHEGSGCCHAGDTEIPEPPEGTDPRDLDLGDILCQAQEEFNALAGRVDKAEAAIAKAAESVPGLIEEALKRWAEATRAAVRTARPDARRTLG